MKFLLSAALILVTAPCFAWNNYYENQSPVTYKTPVTVNYLLCFSNHAPTQQDCDPNVNSVTLQSGEKKVINVPEVTGLNSNAVVVSATSGNITQNYAFLTCVAGTTNGTINFVANTAHNIIECHDD
jgi:hypothetical protein